jgi:hypothetical protein
MQDIEVFHEENFSLESIVLNKPLECEIEIKHPGLKAYMVIKLYFVFSYFLLHEVFQKSK